MFRATHIFGPLSGEENDVSMAAPRVPGRLFYAPAPGGLPGHALVAGYLLVGYDQPPETPWPGQVEYVLDRERSRLREHSRHEEMEEGVAVYVLAGDS